MSVNKLQNYLVTLLYVKWCSFVISRDLLFCRCIKPNHMKSPNVFDAKLVMDQLRSTGMLEITKIRRLGYPVRLTFDVFLQRYQFTSNSHETIKKNILSCTTYLRCLPSKVSVHF